MTHKPGDLPLFMVCFNSFGGEEEKHKEMRLAIYY